MGTKEFMEKDVKISDALKFVTPIFLVINVIGNKIAKMVDRDMFGGVTALLLIWGILLICAGVFTLLVTSGAAFVVLSPFWGLATTGGVLVIFYTLLGMGGIVDRKAANSSFSDLKDRFKGE